MPGHLSDRIGFGVPASGRGTPRRQPVPLEVIASTSLALSTVLVATTVTIGMARADGMAAPMLDLGHAAEIVSMFGF